MDFFWSQMRMRTEKKEGKYFLKEKNNRNPGVQERVNGNRKDWENGGLCKMN